MCIRDSYTYGGLQKAEIGDEITVVLKIRSQNGKYVNDVAIVD